MIDINSCPTSHSRIIPFSHWPGYSEFDYIWLSSNKEHRTAISTKLMWTDEFPISRSTPPPVFLKLRSITSVTIHPVRPSRNLKAPLPFLQPTPKQILSKIPQVWLRVPSQGSDFIGMLRRLNEILNGNAR